MSNDPVLSVALLCALIFSARVVDVSLGTLRMAAVVRGSRRWAFILGFFEVLVWVTAVSKVIRNLDVPWYAISYALGFATGTFVGITIERKLAIGEQVVRVFSRHGDRIAAAIRELGHAVTVFEGKGRDGEVLLLYTKVPRRTVPLVVAAARAADSDCFYVVEDVRATSSTAPENWLQRLTPLGALQRK